MKIRLIKRPPPEMIVYRCDKCSVTIKAISGASDVQHQCLKTRHWSSLKP